MKKDLKIIVTTYPFGDPDPMPLKLLSQITECNTITYNNAKRKYSREEHLEVLKRENPDIIIAGTEKYDKEAYDLCPKLKMISRVGIGLDSVDLKIAQKRGIIVTYTPDAPSNAVAELAVCQMLNMLRRVSWVGSRMRAGHWSRFIGRDIRDCNVGIIGIGRIGNLVIEKLQGLKPRRIYINDIDHMRMENKDRCEPATKYQILSKCDVVTIHIPWSEENNNFITKEELSLMKPDACLLNMSRGGIVNEGDLYEWLVFNTKASGAIDTFIDEPYTGELTKLGNTYLTPHLGSCTLKSRFDMECGAAEEVISYVKKTRRYNNRVV